MKEISLVMLVLLVSNYIATCTLILIVSIHCPHAMIWSSCNSGKMEPCVGAF